MKTIIIEMDGLELITVRRDREMAECLRRVARAVRELLNQDQVRQDAASCDPEFLALCDRGAARLTILGARKETTLIVDATYLIDAHTAVSLLARSRNLTQSGREDILQVLGFLSAILPLWLMTGNLPPWEKIRDTGTSLGRVPQIYEALRLHPASECGFCPIKMSDALILREGIKLKVHPALQALCAELTHVTKTHRYALAALMRNSE